ncbi:YheC/YheD family protein [Dehalobacterium formicoaceticum]|uniref:YheC/YheD family endospore coat-associated protein n=1 Tax=Dehalobacterium formicoaceticum TaxID=51515 RepID=UPI0031F7039A
MHNEEEARSNLENKNFDEADADLLIEDRQKHFYRVKTVELVMHEDQELKNTICLPEHFLPENKDREEIKLTFGLKNIKVKIQPEQKTGLIVLSKDIFESFGLCENMKIGARFENGAVKLGPLVGVFMNEHAVGRLKKGNPTKKLMEMARAANRARVALYFFSVDDVIWTEKMVHGVFLNFATNTWEIKKLPIPNVLYDRGGGFKKNSRAQALSLRKQWHRYPHLLKINAQHYFDKWKVHDQLSKYPELKCYLPETLLFDHTAEGIEHMVNKYPEVYLKMRTGSNGRQIIRVRKQSPELYELSYFKEKIINEYAQSAEQIVQIADNFMNYKSFIIQQGLDVLTYKNSKVDIRVLMQKDRKGEWQITSMPVRIAYADCPVTSTKSGSRVYAFDYAFKNVLQYPQKKTEEIKAKITKLVYTAAGTLEEEYGSLGELGIDVAIDRNGQLWFIEVNSKPAKDTIMIAGIKYEINRAFILPFEYSKYLTGFIPPAKHHNEKETTGKLSDSELPHTEDKE